MGAFTISVAAPHATAYDSNNPTRSTENLNHELHEVLQDMEDNSFIVTDNCPTSTVRSNWLDYMYNNIEEVWDYANDAITNYRTSGSPALAKPTKTKIGAPNQFINYPWLYKIASDLYIRATQTLFFIYYMWESEEDPLLLKEKLQELLIAWPLMDTTIDLQTESGQTIRMYPSWKNVDLDL